MYITVECGLDMMTNEREKMDRPKQQESSGKEPGCLATFVVVFAAMIAAPIAGLLLGGALAPSSDLAQAVGLVSPLASLFLGVLLWLGTLALRLVWQLVLLPFRLITGRKARRDRKGQGVDQMPPGSFAFVPATVVVCTICGAVIGLLSETTGLLLATMAFAGIGLVYGVILWRLAKHGYLDGVVEGVLRIGLE
jgi:hypothetical protein